MVSWMESQNMESQNSEVQNLKIQDNDFKYYMQDTGHLYFGARYSYTELMEHEMVPFKFKSIIEHYIMKAGYDAGEPVLLYGAGDVLL